MKMIYTRVGDYYIPNLKVEREERSIGKWGRMYRDYMKEYHPIRFNQLALSGKLWTHLADLNEQAQLAHGNADSSNAGRRGSNRGIESLRSYGLGAAYKQYPHQCRRDRPRGADLRINITEFISRLKAYVDAHTRNYQGGDAESLLESPGVTTGCSGSRIMLSLTSPTPGVALQSM